MIMMERVSNMGSTVCIVPRCETHWMNNHVYSFMGYIILAGCRSGRTVRAVNPVRQLHRGFESHPASIIVNLYECQQQGCHGYAADINCVTNV